MRAVRYFQPTQPVVNMNIIYLYTILVELVLEKKNIDGVVSALRTQAIGNKFFVFFARIEQMDCLRILVAASPLPAIAGHCYRPKITSASELCSRTAAIMTI